MQSIQSEQLRSYTMTSIPLSEFFLTFIMATAHSYCNVKLLNYNETVCMMMLSGVVIKHKKVS